VNQSLRRIEVQQNTIPVIPASIVSQKTLFSTAVSPLGALLIAVATAAIIWGCIAGVAALGARAAPAPKPASADLMEITRALGSTQQQAIDQL
jgi:hypothetical protein